MITPEAIEYLKPIVHRYGYLSIFCGVMLENTGIPVPGETVLIIGGILCGLGLLYYPYLILFTVMGAILGDNFGYWIGLKGGRTLFEKYGKYIFIKDHQIQQADDFFAKFGDITIFFARFITGIRVFGAIFAGAARMPWKRFLFFNATGAIAWALTFGTLGYLFAKSVESLGSFVMSIEVGIFILVILVILLLWHKRHRNSSQS